MPNELLNVDNPLILYLSIIIQLLLLMFGAYYLLVSVFAWVKRREPELLTNKVHRFALVIAAHNEETVIAHMVYSLKRLNYPKDSYDIMVIADNCTDNTAAVARAAGAMVFERFNMKDRGKGFALEWMFKKIFAMDADYDSIAVFDADNVVHPDFLEHMNLRHNQGFKVIQGYIDSKNPYDSWISSSYTVSFWSINRLFQLSRYNLGLSCQLCGTGFVIQKDLLREIGWHATCLTEDMEFTMRLVLNDQVVAWSHDAIVYDEKPLTLTASWRQRKRWMQGHADVASRFSKPLIQKAVKEKDWRPVDCLLYLLQPLRVVVLGLITLLAWIQSFCPPGSLGFFQFWMLFDSPLIWNMIVLAQFCYLPLVIWFERGEFNGKLVLSYVTYYIYSLTWVPITVQGIIDKNKKEWSHTPHTRTISIKEFEEA